MGQIYSRGWRRRRGASSCARPFCGCCPCAPRKMGSLEIEGAFPRADFFHRNGIRRAALRFAALSPNGAPVACRNTALIPPG